MFKSEKQKIRFTLVGIIIITIIVALVNFGKEYNKYVGSALPNMIEVPFRLGLDLLGGTHLVYQADVSGLEAKDRIAAVEGVRDVIERRVNIFGVSEPVVQVAKSGDDHRIIVELAGIKDVNQAINMIGETPLLEFKEQNEEVKELTPEQEKEMNEFNKEAGKKANKALARINAGEDFLNLAKEISEDTPANRSGASEKGNLGWINNTSGYPEILSEVDKIEIGNTSGLIEDDNGYNIIKPVEKRAVKEDGGLGLDKLEVKASHILICFEGTQTCESGLSKEDARSKIDNLKTQANPENFTGLAKDNSTGPSAPKGGDLGWFAREMMVKPFSDAVFSIQTGEISDIVETDFGWHLIYKQDERPIYEYKINRIFIDKKTKVDIVGSEDPWKNTELTGKYLQRASVQFNPNDNSPEVRLEFDSEGKDFFAKITERNVGKPVAIYLDNFPISIPTVNEAIKSGDAIISGRFDIKEAKLLAQRLNAGALPIPIDLINQQTIGATLGKVSVEKSLQAGMIGVVLVAIFMILVYRLPGILAVISLTIYGLIVLAIFKLWPVTLTLAGLAGFILSIGMAVDANVLIFARFKEELRDGKSVGKAIDEAFRRAWPSIRDGNFSTLLTCVVLIMFTTSIVKGFAVTLALGILVSMFSAIVITKILMQVVITDKFENKKWLLGVKK